ncbi:SRPBCC family protein [Halosimplex aquaticum]
MYDHWRDPETHEQIWAHFAEVDRIGEDRQHWAVGGPRNTTVEWDAETVAAEPGEFLRWKSLPGARIPNEGSVRFKSRENGEETEVTLHLRFDPPGGRVGTALAERFDLLPDAAAGTALRRFKSLVETGEIPTLEHNPSARGEGDLV